VLGLVVGITCATWSPAQEEVHPPRKPVSKADQEARTKAIEKKRLAKAKADAEARAKAVDINRASKDQLKKLPGISDAYADAIIAKRPYHSKAELVTKNALPLGIYQTIRKQVAAK
jgi:DNA uptake protein ComE-like DNA-binding protein